MQVAAAHGALHPWIRDIQGADVWALQMASMRAQLAAALRTDCKSTLEGLSAVRASAAAS